MKTRIEGKYSTWHLKEAVKHTRLNRYEREQLYIIIDNLDYPRIAIEKVDPSDLFEKVQQNHDESIFDDLVRMLGELHKLKLSNLAERKSQREQEEIEQRKTKAMVDYFSKFGITDQAIMKKLQGD